MRGKISFENLKTSFKLETSIKSSESAYVIKYRKLICDMQETT
jgi:hypothetical protein